MHWETKKLCDSLYRKYVRNMGDCKVGNADDTPAFINNSSEKSEVTCACDKLKTELQKTSIELKSAQKIIVLL
jgi:hypothetical protein